MLFDLNLNETLIIGLLFIWTGFVRTGLGFGGAALGLPFMLFVRPDLLLWLPMIGVHLLFFSGLTLSRRLHHVDWRYLGYSLWFILPPAFMGVFRLVNLPALWLNVFIYTVTIFYGTIWLFNRAIQSQKNWVDKVLLIVGGYVAGISLTGAPLMVTVFMRNVERKRLRDTLFVLWFILVSLKMTTFVALSVDVHFIEALCFIPIAAIGHIVGLKAHHKITQNDRVFKRWVGAGLVIVSALGLFKLSKMACVNENICLIKWVRDYVL
ncbi:MAG: sulfite exporter TauE/SafE family protein [Methylococcales bacterium]|nr:sulfite exporter TauE/SafE family protein [Methylococcales bacterium]